MSKTGKADIVDIRLKFIYTQVDIRKVTSSGSDGNAKIVFFEGESYETARIWLDFGVFGGSFVRRGVFASCGR